MLDCHINFYQIFFGNVYYTVHKFMNVSNREMTLVLKH